MALTAPPDRTRIGAALAAAAVELGLAAMVIWGLATRWTAPHSRVPSIVTITPSVQPSRPPPPATDQGAAAPPDRKGGALPVSAPSPPVALITPRPAATVAGRSNEASSGAAAVSGPGNGAGGSVGTGSGVGGFAAGSDAVTTAVRIAGALTDRDYPRRSRASGTVAIAFRVRGDGRVDRCAVIASSGEALLDDLTCELVQRRFRYRPARDVADRPVDSTLRASFTWGTRLRD